MGDWIVRVRTRGSPAGEWRVVVYCMGEEREWTVPTGMRVSVSIGRACHDDNLVDTLALVAIFTPRCRAWPGAGLGFRLLLEMVATFGSDTEELHVLIYYARRACHMQRQNHGG